LQNFHSKKQPTGLKVESIQNLERSYKERDGTYLLTRIIKDTQVLITERLEFEGYTNPETVMKRKRLRDKIIKSLCINYQISLILTCLWLSFLAIVTYSFYFSYSRNLNKLKNFHLVLSSLNLDSNQTGE
jgi:hypothetical protein